jgi:dipeptidyl aminopeptidase/acylaminoacyl peptidase
VTSTSPRRGIEPDDLYAIKGVTDVQLSLDGRRVAYVVSEIDREADDYHTSIWLVPVEGGEPVRFSQGPKKDSAPRWSPDGSQIAFLSDRDGGAPQLYVIPADGGEARKLTSLEKGAGAPAWSPDGARIAFAARWLVEEPPKDKDERARWNQRPKVITRAQYRNDGQGYTLDAPSRLFVVDVSSEAAPEDLRPFIESDGEDVAPVWSPDGRRIAFTRTRAGVLDYSLSDLWVVGSDGMGARRLTVNVGRAQLPAWSPDGTQIAVYGTDEQEPGFSGGLPYVWIVPANDVGEPRCLTAGHDRFAYLPASPLAPRPPMWSPDGASITFLMANEGCIQLVRASTGDGAVQPVLSGERWVVGADIRAERIAFIAHSAEDPGDVLVRDLAGGGERRLTDLNREWLESVALPAVERRRFASPNGGEIDGWLFMPTRTSSPDHPERVGGPAPLVLQVHGGPHSFAGSRFESTAFYAYVLANRGWAVLALNPTGSGSYGKEFAHAIRERWGEHDLPEQLAAADALIEEGLVDPQRLAITGYSYGGYMTSWAIGHSDRFKAAVVGAPVTNFESFHGTSDIGPWFSPWELRGALAEKRDLYRRLSPIQSAHLATAPTLILHGESDDRCPIGQGEELYMALLTAGRVPVGFVRYPGGAHGFVSTGRPSHRVDYSRRVVDWLTEHVR